MPVVGAEQVSYGFGSHPLTPTKWLRQDRADTGIQTGDHHYGVGSLHDSNWWIRFLEQENEVLRRAAAYLSQARTCWGNAPSTRERACRRQVARCWGVEACLLALLPMACLFGG